jgi:hypothetical protein
MRITFISLFIICSFTAFSQQSDNTNSPYTRYGYGVLADQTFAPQRGMGGIGYGLRNSQIINPLNPASFSAVDTMTFMLDFGVKGQAALLNDGVFGSARRYNGGLEYLALQIPLAKGLGLGVGIEPVSFVGYQYGNTTIHPNASSSEIYSGNGGLSKFYTTLSYKFFNRVSLGVNVGYLFGDIVHNRTANFSGDSYLTSWIDSLHVSNLTFEAGLQYIQPLSNNSELVFGAVYTPKTTMKVNLRAIEAAYDNQTGAATREPTRYSTTDSIFQLPETYGIGITYHQRDKLTLGADFQYQKWADTQYQFYKWGGPQFYEGYSGGKLTNRMKINLGGEYIPNLRKNNLLNRIRYRAGGYFANSYIIDSNSSKYNEYGLSAGLGFPIRMPDARERHSFINLAFEYSHLAPQKAVSMSEQYFKITLSYTFNELWFYKQKLQ